MKPLTETSPRGEDSISTDSLFFREKISAIVISYNRINIIETCLRALSFADEILVFDKSSSDGTRELAATLADKVTVLPWSPVVEHTRTFAISQCKYEWILCLDDDECLSPPAIQFIQNELKSPRAEIYTFAQRHYILGQHSENAYYWPESQIRFFKRNAITFDQTVHGGAHIISESIYKVPSDTGICIHHLSHTDVSQWIEKTNRYTSISDRVSAPHSGDDLVAFAHARIDEWQSKSSRSEQGSYESAVAILRALYDIIDRLKIWEAEHGIDGVARFEEICQTLKQCYAKELIQPLASNTEHPSDPKS